MSTRCCDRSLTGLVFPQARNLLCDWNMRFEVMFIEGGGIIRRFVQHYKSSHRIPFDYLAQHPRHPLQSDFEHGGSIALKSFPVLLGSHIIDQNVPNGVADIS